jgi:hypothetical protein
VHAADCQGEQQRRQDEYEDGEGADIGRGSLTILREGGQSESVWALLIRRDALSVPSAVRTGASSILITYVDSCQYILLTIYRD